MKIIGIEKHLRNELIRLVTKYDWLTIKYEYNEMYGCHLVSYSPITLINVSEDFITDSMQLQRKMEDLYDDAAPLFCDEEDIFKLTPNATMLCGNSTIMSKATTFVEGSDSRWASTSDLLNVSQYNFAA